MARPIVYCIFKNGGYMKKTTQIEIKHELNRMRFGGITARAMAHLLEVSEATVHGWLRFDNTFVPRADQIDTLRAFASEDNK